VGRHVDASLSQRQTGALILARSRARARSSLYLTILWMGTMIHAAVLLLALPSEGWPKYLIGIFSAIGLMTSIGVLLRLSSAHGGHSVASEEVYPSVSETFAPLPNSRDKSDLDNETWLKLVQECVDLFDELDRSKNDLDAAPRAISQHVMDRYLEIFERCGLEIISGNEHFDRNRHSIIDSASSSKKELYVDEVISPGFAIGNRVLRRAHVRVVAPAEE
jgi:hypothetical protein